MSVLDSLVIVSVGLESHRSLEHSVTTSKVTAAVSC